MQEKKHFDTREDIKKYLVEILRELNKRGEFNIFVHQINNFRDFWVSDGDIQQKIDGIFRNGLRIGDYSSLFGTTNLACVSSSLDADLILDYDYHHEQTFPTCVIAIPKYIFVDGEKVEYSTYKSNSKGVREEIRQAFEQKNINVDGHHLKRSIFDAIKGYRNLPHHYVVGIVRKEEKGYSFVENLGQLKNANDEQYQNYQNVIAEKIKQAYQEYNSKNPIDLIVKSYQKEQKWRDAQLDDYD